MDSSTFDRLTKRYSLLGVVLGFCLYFVLLVGSSWLLINNSNKLAKVSSLLGDKKKELERAQRLYADAVEYNNKLEGQYRDLEQRLRLGEVAWKGTTGLGYFAASPSPQYDYDNPAVNNFWRRYSEAVALQEQHRLDSLLPTNFDSFDFALYLLLGSDYHKLPKSINDDYLSKHCDVISLDSIKSGDIIYFSGARVGMYFWQLDANNQRNEFVVLRGPDSPAIMALRFREMIRLKRVKVFSVLRWRG